jgi:hypothetical protein
LSNSQACVYVPLKDNVLEDICNSCAKFLSKKISVDLRNQSLKIYKKVAELKPSIIEKLLKERQQDNESKDVVELLQSFVGKPIQDVTS